MPKLPPVTPSQGRSHDEMSSSQESDIVETTKTKNGIRVVERTSQKSRTVTVLHMLGDLLEDR